MIYICIMHKERNEKKSVIKIAMFFCGFLVHNLPPLVNNFLRKRYKKNITTK